MDVEAKKFHRLALSANRQRSTAQYWSVVVEGPASAEILAGGPMHLASPDEVHVQVADSLSAVWAGVDDGAVAAIELMLAGKLIGDAVQMSDDGFLVIGASDLIE